MCCFSDDYKSDVIDGPGPDDFKSVCDDVHPDRKERAEHVMLVDLARNDIGRVCDFGSVQVKDLMIIERCSHVMHIVSSVEGKRAAGKTPYDLMRAMQIIADLEGTTRVPDE